MDPVKYSKGLETIRSKVVLFRSSVHLHVFVALFSGLVIGSFWFKIGLEDRPSGNILQYAKASILATISEGKQIRIRIDGKEVEVKSGAACAYFRTDIFKGRTWSFLVQQWAFKASIAALISFALVWLFLAKYGEKYSSEERKRGGRLEDFTLRKRKRVSSRYYLYAALSLLLGFVVRFLSLGPDGRDNFSNYFWSSMYLTSDTIASIASLDGRGKSAWYEAQDRQGFIDNFEIHEWLSKKVYRRSMASILFQISLLGSICFLWFIGYERIKRSKKSKATSGSLFIGGVALEPGSECKHILATGSPGSGKSTAIKELLDQVRSSGKRAIVYDVSGEYISRYFRKETDVILNPLDDRSVRWNLWEEITADTDYFSIGKSLFPPIGNDQFWSDAGATLFAATAKKLKDVAPTNKSLYSYLCEKKIEDLMKFLEDTAAGKLLDPKAGAMPSNLIATVVAKIGAWQHLKDAEAGKRAFSIRRFIEDDKTDSWMFISLKQDQMDTLRPLISLWCDIAANGILSLPPSRERRIWIVLDEVASLQKLNALGSVLERGRKHGCAVVLGLQSMPQLRDIYGRDGAAALASQPQTWIVLRSVEPETAKWLESALGEYETEEFKESVALGGGNARTGVSISQQERKKSLIMAGEIQSLPDLVGYLKMPGDRPIYKIKLELKPDPT